jgi:hypothetical protein
LGSWWSSSLGLLLVTARGSHGAIKTKINSWQKQLETKHDEKMICRPRVLQGVI